MTLPTKILAAVVATAAVAGAAPAVAGADTHCGTVGSYTVHADERTTTCGLARSTTRNYLRGGRPATVWGHSAKRGRSYKFWRLYDTGRIAKFEGSAGTARLRFYFVPRLTCC